MIASTTRIANINKKTLIKHTTTIANINTTTIKVTTKATKTTTTKVTIKMLLIQVETMRVIQEDMMRAILVVAVIAEGEEMEEVAVDVTEAN